MIYCDTSALVKLLKRETETDALEALLANQQVATSELARAELRRAVMRYDPSLAPGVATLLASIHLVPLTTQLLDEAGALQPASLRSLDAIHLASALLLSVELTALITYDERMLEAAQALGVRVVAP